MSATWRAATWHALEHAAVAGSQPDYAAYAALRAAGRRDEGLAAVGALAQRLAVDPREERWAFVSWLLGEIDEPGAVIDPLVPHALRTAVVLPTLWEEAVRDGGDSRAAIWLVDRFLVEVLLADPRSSDAAGALLRGRLARTPDDPLLRERLARHLVHWVQQDAVALAESRFDGDPLRDLALLEEALALLPAEDPQRDVATALHRDVDAWLRYARDPGAVGTPFPQWRQQEPESSP